MYFRVGEPGFDKYRSWLRGVRQVLAPPEFCFPRRCQLTSLTAIKCVYIYRRHTLIPKLYTLDLGICVISEPDAEVPESCSALEHILVEVSHRGAPPPVRTPPCRHAISGQHLLVAPIAQASLREVIVVARDHTVVGTPEVAWHMHRSMTYACSMAYA